MQLENDTSSVGHPVHTDQATSLNNVHQVPESGSTVVAHIVSNGNIPITSSSAANQIGSNGTTGFKMEKPKMPKFAGDVREYAIFHADFKHAIESKYSKRDSITFLRTCTQDKPLELIN